MFELVKKGLFMGLGAASLTKDKLRQLADDVSREAKLSEEQAQIFRAEMEQKAAESRQELEQEIDTRVDHALVQLGILKAGVKRVTGRTADELQAFIDRRVDEALERFRIARQEDVESLLERVRLLEAKVSPPETVVPPESF